MKKVLQKSRVAKYSFLAIGAIISLIVPSTVVLSGIGLTWSIGWSILLLMGSITSLIGICSRTWVGEYIGLPAIIACLFLYSMVCFFDTGDFNVNRLFLGMIFLGFTGSTTARRADVKFQKRVADYEKRVKDGKPGL